MCVCVACICLSYLVFRLVFITFLCMYFYSIFLLLCCIIFIPKHSIINFLSKINISNKI